MKTKERIQTATFLEVINDNEFSEIELTKDILMTRYRFAKKVEQTALGYEFKYLTMDKKKEIKMELIHAPKFDKQSIKSRNNEDFEAWVAKVYGG